MIGRALVVVAVALVTAGGLLLVALAVSHAHGLAAGRAVMAAGCALVVAVVTSGVWLADTRRAASGEQKVDGRGRQLARLRAGRVRGPGAAPPAAARARRTTRAPGRAAKIGRWLAALAATVGIVLGGDLLAATLVDATGVGAARLIGPLLAVVWLAVLLRWDRRRAVTR